jgi:hypothetical protein
MFTTAHLLGLFFFHNFYVVLFACFHIIKSSAFLSFNEFKFVGQKRKLQRTNIWRVYRLPCFFGYNCHTGLTEPEMHCHGEIV